MKINGAGPVNGVNQYNRAPDNRSYGAENKKRNKKDELVISTEAKELLSLRETPQTQAKSRKLDELKQAVATGTYYVDAHKIAEKLLPFLK